MIEDRDTILEFTAKNQELQNQVNSVNDPRVFKRCSVAILAQATARAVKRTPTMFLSVICLPPAQGGLKNTGHCCVAATCAAIAEEVVNWNDMEKSGITRS